MNLVGQKFNLLTVVRHDGVRHGMNHWLCRCDCGGETSTSSTKLRKGYSKSCGCARVLAGKLKRTHGATAGGKPLPEYGIWVSMRQRCKNPNNRAYAEYGGRGICVFEGWDRSFEAFYRYIGPRPSASHSLDRIDNDRGYEPGNVRWAGKSQQASNRRSARIGVRSDSKSGIKGVFRVSASTWGARIKVNGKFKHLGCFSSPDAASAAFAAAYSQRIGEAT